MKPLAVLDDIVNELDRELRTSELSDYAAAMNGLQLSATGEVRQIFAAVDASLSVVEEASRRGGGILLVHHGLFWQGAQPLTGAYFRKIKMAMDAGLAIYSSHLPLDVHAELGNNVLLARALGLKDLTPFFERKGMHLGLRGRWEGSCAELKKVLSNALRGARIEVSETGPVRIASVGVITGGAGSEVKDVAATGVDAFITGEGPHWSFPLAEELGLHVLYGGHYATETFGVKALAAWLSQKFDLPWEFIDRPTGL